MRDKISVIVPIYKVEKYLNECIESIVNQTYDNLEIILVDDGSPDTCSAICDKWQSKDSRIKVIHKENGGLSDARNSGLDIAEGEYISFVDSDDWIDVNMYEIMVKHIEETKADICACGILACYTDRKCTMNTKFIVGNAKDIYQLLYDEAQYPVAAWNKLYRRFCWNGLRFPVGKICEDAFTTYKLIDQAKVIVQITEPLYFYRIRENSIMTSNFNKKRMDEEEAWRLNYDFIAKKYPELKKKAYDFYLQRVNGLLHAIPKQRKHEFEKEYNYLYGIIRSNIWYLLLLSGLKLKYRIKLVLDFIFL